MKLGQSPVACQLDDVFDAVETQNLPSTIQEHANSLRLCPETVENFKQSQEINTLGGVLEPLLQDT